MTETHYDLIDDEWYPHGNYEEYEVVPEFIEKHISIRDLGYYTGSWPDTAASYGYCFTLGEFHAIYEQAHYASRIMIQSNILSGRTLNKYQKAAFEHAYGQGFMEGQSKIANQLYDLALMGEYKAIDKFLEVRGAFGKESVETGPLVQITLAKEEIKEENKEENKQNLLSFKK